MNNHKHSWSMGQIKSGAAAPVVTLLLLMILCLLTAILTPVAFGQVSETNSIFVPEHRVTIDGVTEMFQFEPVGGMMVVMTFEKMTDSAGAEVWVLGQVAGPWGSSHSILIALFGFNEDWEPEFLLAFQEARRLALWLNDTIDYQWRGRSWLYDSGNRLLEPVGVP